MKINHVTISIYIRFHSCQHTFFPPFDHSVTFETPEKIIIRYARNTPSHLMQSQSQLFVSYLFVHLLSLMHTIYIPSFSFTLIYSRFIYTISLFLSFFFSPSFPFISFSLSLLLTFTHFMLRKQIIYNLTYHICANERKRSLRIMCLLHT